MNLMVSLLPDVYIPSLVRDGQRGDNVDKEIYHDQ